MCKCVVILGILAVLGIAVLVLGFILGFVVFENIIEDGIISAVRLEQNTPQFERFIEMPFPHTFKVYFHTVTNPDEVILGAPPNLAEVGPYVYRQYRFRGNITYNNISDIITYTQHRTFEFDEAASGGRFENDSITVLNVALQSLFEMGDGTALVPTINTAWSEMIGETSIFHSVTVGQYLFSGYQFCTPVVPPPPVNVAVNQLCDYMRNNFVQSRLIDLLPNQALSFSFFNYLNNNNEGVFAILAGMDEISHLGEIQTWNNLQFLNTWEGGNSLCNHIRGRGGVIFPPFSDDQSNFDIFNTDVCRVLQNQSIGYYAILKLPINRREMNKVEKRIEVAIRDFRILNLDYDTTTEFEGIDGFRYTLRQDTLANVSSPNHTCYCINRIRDLTGTLECLPEGFGDMFSCIGLPIVMSLPHLLWANAGYSNTVNGLSPNVNNHTSFADIEPDTGTPLRTATRVQYNMFIRPITGITVTNQLTPSVLPIVWFEEGMELSEGLVNKLNDEYFYMVVAFQAVTWVLVAVGAVVFLICLMCCIIRRNRK